jgi:hypothetical protein
MTTSSSAPPPSDEPTISQSSVPPDPDLERITLPAITPAEIAAEPQSAVLRFGSGRSLTASEAGGEEQIEIRAAGGALILSMRLTADGPVLSLSGVSLEIAAAKSLSLRAETLRVTAEKDIAIESVRGGVEIRANDDVAIVGERVRLNSDDPPMPQTWEEHRARHAVLVEPVLQEPAQEHGEQRAGEPGRDKDDRDQGAR